MLDLVRLYIHSTDEFTCLGLFDSPVALRCSMFGLTFVDWRRQTPGWRRTGTKAHTVNEEHVARDRLRVKRQCVSLTYLSSVMSHDENLMLHVRLTHDSAPRVYRTVRYPPGCRNIFLPTEDVVTQNHGVVDGSRLGNSFAWPCAATVRSTLLHVTQLQCVSIPTLRGEPGLVSSMARRVRTVYSVCRSRRVPLGTPPLQQAAASPSAHGSCPPPGAQAAPSSLASMTYFAERALRRSSCSAQILLSAMIVRRSEASMAELVSPTDEAS